MRRRSVLVPLATILLILPAQALAATSIGEPNYHNEDWFEYDGHTEALVDELTAEWSGDEHFEGVIVDQREEMRVTQQGSEHCGILDWSGGCSKAQITHLVNITLNWAENTTQYENDTINMSISYEAIHWKAQGTAGWEKLDATTTTETRFSGGGEDNLLEQELHVVTQIRRVGDWPDRVELDSSWDIEESLTTHTIERNRENRGPWSESEGNLSSTDQVSYRATEERLVHYGVANEKDHDTLVVVRTSLNDGITYRDHFREEGFLAHTEKWENETLLLSSTLIDFSYYENEPHSYSSSSNWILPTIFIALLLLGVIGAGAAYFALSIVPLPRTEKKEET